MTTATHSLLAVRQFVVLVRHFY